MAGVHCQSPLLEKDTAMVQENMSCGIYDEQRTSQGNHHQRTPTADEGLRAGPCICGASHAVDDGGKDNEVCTKGEVVKGLAVCISFNSATGSWKRSSQKQRPTSAAQDTRQSHEEGGEQHSARSCCVGLCISVIISWHQARVTLSACFRSIRGSSRVRFCRRLRQQRFTDILGSRFRL